MAHVRTYRPDVRVGNWREDVTLEEDTLKDFLDRKERGELMVQKTGFLKQNILKQVSLSVSVGGAVCFGDVVMLVNVCGDNSCSVSIYADLTNLGEGPCPGTHTCFLTLRCVSSVDGSAEGEPLRYNQSFALRTTSGFAGGLYLTSDHKTFQKCAKKSRLQEVIMEHQANFLSWWKVLHNDPHERLEHEGLPVPANSKVLISHCKTNQALAVLGQHILWTPYGKEYEVTAHTFLDSHKAERDINHWLLVTADPAGAGLTLLDHP
uniref:Cilia and flagella associated protein 161 n=1 Tax=Oncorhynchus kisutch TaxID=8019 RepID=A0A8C7FR82_ONCKI